MANLLFISMLCFYMHGFCYGNETINTNSQATNCVHEKKAGEKIVHSGDNWSLQWLYSTNIFAKLVRKLLTQQSVNSFIGWFADRSLSRFFIEPFINAYTINMQEAVIENPNDYHTFNEFFYRSLKTRARSIDENSATIISPADGNLYIIENLTEKTEFLVKNKPFNLAQFLRNTALAEQFYNGTLLVIYLAPHNYHRYHFPLNCTPRHATVIQGTYESVNAIAYRAGIQPLTENERQLIMLKTDIGDVAFVTIGAMMVGRITQTYEPEQFYTKGGQAGYFSFGGSTIALLFKPNTIAIDPVIQEYLKTHESIAVQMGKPLATINNNQS